jgi:hypothetical protein
MGARTSRPRWAARYGPELGTTYLLHFSRPYRHAQHYVGWTQDLTARLNAHVQGEGARLVEVITAAGIGFRLARTWPDTTKDYEDLVKHVGGARRYCPACGVVPRKAVMTATPPPPRRLTLWEMDRLGTYADGTPLPAEPAYA